MHITWKHITQTAAQATRAVLGALRNRWVRWSIQIIVLAFCLGYLISLSEQIKSLLADVEINYTALFISWIFATISLYLGIPSWAWTLACLGQPVNWPIYARAQLTSNLIKYLPGYAWQYLGKAYITSQAGISGQVIGIGLLLEFCLTVVVGLALGSLLLPAELLTPLVGIPTPWIQALRGMTTAGCLLALGVGLPVILGGLARRGLIPAWRPWPLLGMITILVTGWLMLGLSFWSLEWVFQPAGDHLRYFLFSLIASYLVGLAIIIIPNSIGVREGIMALLLGQIVSWPVAVLIATTSRLIYILSELFGFLTIKIYERLARPSTPRHPHQ